ncbi:hypothetical protein HDU76_004734 [Blyttiomyces sp. JEL0837]|nr:hypothetical protein HDU76_004734 [Blyttiomyces sp. JEL0837]
MISEYWEALKTLKPMQFKLCQKRLERNKPLCHLPVGAAIRSPPAATLVPLPPAVGTVCNRAGATRNRIREGERPVDDPGFWIELPRTSYSSASLLTETTPLVPLINVAVDIPHRAVHIMIDISQARRNRIIKHCLCYECKACPCPLILPVSGFTIPIYRK